MRPPPLVCSPQHPPSQSRINNDVNCVINSIPFPYPCARPKDPTPHGMSVNMSQQSIPNQIRQNRYTIRSRLRFFFQFGLLINSTRLEQLSPGLQSQKFPAELSRTRWGRRRASEHICSWGCVNFPNLGMFGSVSTVRSNFFVCHHAQSKLEDVTTTTIVDNFYQMQVL